MVEIGPLKSLGLFQSLRFQSIDWNQVIEINKPNNIGKLISTTEIENKTRLIEIQPTEIIELIKTGYYFNQPYIYV